MVADVAKCYWEECWKVSSTPFRFHGWIWQLALSLLPSLFTADSKILIVSRIQSDIGAWSLSVSGSGRYEGLWREEQRQRLCFYGSKQKQVVANLVKRDPDLTLLPSSKLTFSIGLKWIWWDDGLVWQRLNCCDEIRNTYHYFETCTTCITHLSVVSFSFVTTASIFSRLITNPVNYLKWPMRKSPVESVSVT